MSTIFIQLLTILYGLHQRKCSNLTSCKEILTLAHVTRNDVIYTDRKLFNHKDPEYLPPQYRTCLLISRLIKMIPYSTRNCTSLLMSNEDYFYGIAVAMGVRLVPCTQRAWMLTVVKMFERFVWPRVRSRLRVRGWARRTRSQTWFGPYVERVGD